MRFVNGLASGHPLLLSLAADYLQRHDWQFDDAGLTGLLRGEHASALAEDVDEPWREMTAEERERMDEVSAWLYELGDWCPACGLDRPRYDEVNAAVRSAYATVLGGKHSTAEPWFREKDATP